MSSNKVESYFMIKCFDSFVRIFLAPLTLLSWIVAASLSRMVDFYERYFYNLLDFYLSPKLAKISKTIQIGENQLTLFTATNLIYFRTLLIVPVGLSLKYNYPFVAFAFVLLNGFLDQIDLLVAEVQHVRDDDQSDDPVFENFLDSFCNKFINVLCLWTILQEIHLNDTSMFISLVFILLCYTTMIVEIALAIVSVQNYFYSLLSKKKEIFSPSAKDFMEGKLKETIESLGMACLCLSLGSPEPFEHWPGAIGMLSLFLTVRFGYHSLKKTTEFERLIKITKRKVRIQPTITIKKTIAVFDALTPKTSKETRSRAMTLGGASTESEKKFISNQVVNKQTSFEWIENEQFNFESRKNSLEKSNGEIDKIKSDRTCSTSSSESVEAPAHTFQRSASLPAIWIDGRADKVYTVGCFDLFHDGHKILLQRMRQFGREVIVGVHDSRSIYKLKSRVPVDGTETRMLNVKRYADQVFCVAGTDPSNFITAITHIKENETAVYIRGDDMADFPSRNVVEQLMPVKFLPYTSGVSSTQLRKELFSHIQANDVEHLEKVN